jgi:hypothetical protein
MDKRGLFANGQDYKIYGTTDKAKIVVKKGSVLNKAFLTKDANDAYAVLPPNADKEVTISHKTPAGESVSYTDAGPSGYLTWDIPN